MSTSLTPEQQQLYQTLQEQMRADGTREQSDTREQMEGNSRTAGSSRRQASAHIGLKSFLKARLVATQWQKELANTCQGVITSRGLQEVTVEELVKATQQAAQAVPDSIRQEFKEHVRQSLIEQAEATLAASNKPVPPSVG